MDAWIKTGSCRKRQTSATSVDVPTTSSTNILCSEPRHVSDSESTEFELTTSSRPNSNGRAKIAKKAKPTRKYNADYLKYGFVCTGTDDDPLPQCVICFEVLANESMKPSKLERHLSTKHTEYAMKPLDFFQYKKIELLKSKSVMKTSISGEQNRQATIASYRLSLLIAKNGAAHSVGENIILPAAKIISEALFTEKQTKKIGEIPLSNTTVKRRIDEMSDAVKQSVVTIIKQSEYFSLQLDESTDIAGQANLLAFVRFELNGSIEEELLFCKSLPSTTTGEGIFKCLDDFVTENEIKWSKCVGLTTDGARAMSGIYVGLIARVRAVAPSVKWTHCSLHREALAVKGLNESLKGTLDDAVKIVNFIKSRPKQSRLFAILCDEMGSEHKALLLHCEVRWLSRGKVLTRLFELRDELRLFFLEDDDGAKSVTKFLEKLHDENWLIQLAYLSDVFSTLNILNLTLQGKDVHKFYVQDKIEANIKKLERWANKVEQSSFDAFPLLNDFLETYGLKVSEEITSAIKEHLRALATSLRKYFPKIQDELLWIRNPFDDDSLSKVKLSTSEEDSLTELSCDFALKSTFKDSSLIPFWIKARGEYPVLSTIALKELMGFTTTYLCERAFSTLVYLKNKYRNRLCVENDLRLKLSTFNPDIESLVSRKNQLHKSH